MWFRFLTFVCTCSIAACFLACNGTGQPKPTLAVAITGKSPAVSTKAKRPPNVSTEHKPDLHFVADDWIKAQNAAETEAFRGDSSKLNQLVGKVVQITGFVRYMDSSGDDDEVVVCLSGAYTKDTEGVFFGIRNDQAAILAKGQPATVRARVELRSHNDVSYLHLGGCIVARPKLGN